MIVSSCLGANSKPLLHSICEYLPSTRTGDERNRLGPSSWDAKETPLFPVPARQTTIGVLIAPSDEGAGHKGTWKYPFGTV
jgi:hypothetical protein